MAIDPSSVNSSSPLKYISNKFTNDTRTSIIVNGQTISLVPAAEFTKNFPQSFSSFGKVELSDGTPYLYSFGEITSDMPTAGKARYEGKYYEAVYNSAAEEGEGYERSGNFAALVDFANKSIFVGIGTEHLARSIKAKIEGSSFTGIDREIFGGDIESVEGRFYGPQASEIGGVYHGKHKYVKDGLNFMGSFGGTRGHIEE
ncbi:transferrin-binding protein-like solute binding protein [Suttonella indologenes]|uniref:transferrin-binding protein-like solute binding protein n=1 Tax=Suttonella indologenes TaxID=13276 RepID=UPI0011C01C23|nr:transferrin-binding protein-like solute binding protein [Suttonella indologenes]